MKLDGLLTQVNLATFAPLAQPPAEAWFHDYGWIPNACIGWRDGVIRYSGPIADAPSLSPAATWDGQGCVVTPGLIDCHTHLVYAGDRGDEFEAIRQGRTYQEIANQGGGILKTVRATRDADSETLYELASERMGCWLREGVTTMEIKSGYGLTRESEQKMLQVIRRLGAENPIRVVATCLAAHKIPPEFEGRGDDYLNQVIDDWLPSFAEEGLAESVDLFCESIAFDAGQARRYFDAASRLGFSLKGHVEQLSASGGVDAVCDYHGVSADHLEYASPQQAKRMGQAGVTAVLLPGAGYYLNEARVPPIEAFRKYQVPMAIGTDHNPGSSPMTSLLAAANLACVLYRLTPAEALAGITRNAAAALELEYQVGQLAEGMEADLALWDIDHPRDLVIRLGAREPQLVFWKGEQRS